MGDREINVTGEVTAFDEHCTAAPLDEFANIFPTKIRGVL